MALREVLLGARHAVGSVVETLHIEISPETQVEVNICRPGLNARDRAMSLTNDEGKITEFSKMQALCVVACVRDPETGARVFDDTDIEELAKGSCGSWFDDLAKRCLQLVMPSASAEGNSGE